jgi:hypothetical protein
VGTLIRHVFGWPAVFGCVPGTTRLAVLPIACVLAQISKQSLSKTLPPQQKQMLARCNLLHRAMTASDARGLIVLERPVLADEQRLRLQALGVVHVPAWNRTAELPPGMEALFGRCCVEGAASNMIAPADFATLKKGKWLNDNVINAFGTVLNRENPAICVVDTHLPQHNGAAGQDIHSCVYAVVCACCRGGSLLTRTLKLSERCLVSALVVLVLLTRAGQC